MTRINVDKRLEPPNINERFNVSIPGINITEEKTDPKYGRYFVFDYKGVRFPLPMAHDGHENERLNRLITLIQEAQIRLQQLDLVTRITGFKGFSKVNTNDKELKLTGFPVVGSETTIVTNDELRNILIGQSPTFSGFYNEQLQVSQSLTTLCKPFFDGIKPEVSNIPYSEIKTAKE